MADTEQAAAHTPDATLEHVGPGRRTYVLIAVVLAVLTVIETQLPTLLKDNLTLLAYAVLTGTVLKAGLVAAIFMHLAAEKRLIYRILIFTGFFVMGLFWLILLAWYDFPIFH